MTNRERTAIRNLYYFHRYHKASIARLLGLSDERIRVILDEKATMILNPDLHCLICGREDPPPTRFFIDGNVNNNNPQNIIMLCEFDSRMCIHLQMRKRKGILRPLL